MRMIQISCRTLLCATAFIAVTTTAQAQFDENSAIWPKTFIGEPDFDFLRQDVIEEYKKKKGGESIKYISTLNDLLEASNIDPFIPRPRTADIGRSKYSKDVFEQRFVQKSTNKKFRAVYPDVTIGTGLEIRMQSGDIVQAKLISDTQAQTLDEENPLTFHIEVSEDGYVIEAVHTDSISDTFSKLFTSADAKVDLVSNPNEENTQLSDLPAYSLAVNQLPEIENVSEEVKENLTEFAMFLENIIKQTQRTQASDLKNIDFTKYLKGLALQTISMSPNKYVVINEMRLLEGDRIPVTISYEKKSKEDLVKVIDTYMPSEKGLPEEVYAQYLNLKTTALNAYEEKQVEDEVLLEEPQNKVQTVSAIIKRIESRQVILSILDKEYPIRILYAL